MQSLDLTNYNYLALIFDCDGTLVNTAPLHFRAIRGAFAAQGFTIGEEWYRDRVGISRTALFQEFEKNHLIQLDHEAAIRISSALFFAAIDEVSENPFATSVVRQHYGKVPMAVASGGQRGLVEASLNTCGLLKLFDTVVTRDDVKQGKPAPDVFLEAATRLNVQPSQCLVFEDSKEGIEAAKSAAMQVIDIRIYQNK